MLAKIAAAEDTAMGVHIVTQFAFDAGAMIAWLDRLRADGIDHPVRVGLAGPTRLATLMKYAQRCGVKASAQGMARMGGLAKHLIGGSAPDDLVRALAQACADGRLGLVTPHFFSFGGVAQTARWAAAAAAGDFRLSPGGFTLGA
jgi:methylenetetrahydrofolate reductase (NADPH)